MIAYIRLKCSQRHMAWKLWFVTKYTSNANVTFRRLININNASTACWLPSSLIISFVRKFSQYSVGVSSRKTALGVWRVFCVDASAKFESGNIERAVGAAYWLCVVRHGRGAAPALSVCDRAPSSPVALPSVSRVWSQCHRSHKMFALVAPDPVRVSVL